MIFSLLAKGRKARTLLLNYGFKLTFIPIFIDLGLWMEDGR
jgi:hypothetical protein